LLALRTNARNHIIDVVWCVANHLSLAGACLCLRVVIGAMIEALGHTKELIASINVLTEVYIVALIDIALIHVASE